MPETDPYAINPMCSHRDAMIAETQLSDGTRAKPFFLYAGNVEPREAEPIQFFGNVYQEITWEGTDDKGYQAAELEVVHFNMTAEHPQFGKLTITIDASRPGGSATLRAVNRGSKFPVIHTTRLHVTAVSSAMPNVILQNQGPPLEFKSEPLSVWPPVNTIYTLRTKVQFEDRRNPGQVFVTASAGAVMVGVPQ
jgi:hypothetical protein